jgi:hypothetical protein
MQCTMKFIYIYLCFDTDSLREEAPGKAMANGSFSSCFIIIEYLQIAKHQHMQSFCGIVFFFKY